MPNLTTLPPDIQTYILNLKGDLLSLKGEREKLEAENQRLGVILKIREEQIKLLSIQRWGPKADKLSKDQLLLLPEELAVSSPEIESEASLSEEKKSVERVIKARAPRGAHRGRDPLPSHLERRETIIPCHPAECRCPKCGEERPLIGYEVREELGCVPATFFVKVIKREKRGSHCEADQGVVVAPAPLQIVPKGKLSNEFVVEVLAQKFQQHTPVYRQCASLLEDHGIDMSRQTINNAILAAAELLEPVVRAQKAELIKGNYLQVDETTLPCQTGEKTGKNHRAYLWEMGVPGGPVVFHFDMGRSRAALHSMIQGFKGWIQCDGYIAYDKLGDGIIGVACMAHIRRKFVEAGKLAASDPLPKEMVEHFRKLYAIEREARDREMNVDERKELREARSRPIMNRIQQRMVEIRQETFPGSCLAKACDYGLKQWPRMEIYLSHGHIEIDNNRCEAGMRPVALGRKNWLHIGGERVGPKVAATISIVETCRRLDIPLRAYLLDILPRLGEWPINRVSELTPTAWQDARNTSTAAS